MREMGTVCKGAESWPLSSIFFGGGTPSLMAPEYARELINKARQLFGFTDNIEITLEANPTSSEAAKFKAFNDAGINRFSVGMQSPEENDLAFLGREHSKDEALNAVKDAMAVTDNVSLDLIYGLPNQNLELWAENLKVLAGLGTPHISCYQLTIEKNTKFYADMNKGRLTPSPDHSQADFYKKTNQVLTEAGFSQYEVSNYARGSAECRHNKHIWQYGSYIGIGAGAHGRTRQKDGVLLATRNYKKPETYIQKVADAGHGRYEIEQVLPNQQVTEATLLGLRLSEGLPLSRLEELAGNAYEDYISSQGVELMETNGFLIAGNKQRKDVLQATPQGMAMLESVLGYVLK